MKRYIPVIALFVLGVILTVSMLSQNDKNIQTNMHGKTIANFELPSLYKKDPALTDKVLKQGGWKILNIFASWCEECPEEHPLLQHLAKIVPIYGIAFKDNPQHSKNYLNKMGNIYTTVAIDETGSSGIKLGISGVPETYVIDANGVIRFKYKGALTSQVLQNHILPLIGN